MGVVDTAKPNLLEIFEQAQKHVRDAEALTADARTKFDEARSAFDVAMVAEAKASAELQVARQALAEGPDPAANRLSDYHEAYRLRPASGYGLGGTVVPELVTDVKLALNRGERTIEFGHVSIFFIAEATFQLDAMGISMVPDFASNTCTVGPKPK